MSRLILYRGFGSPPSRAAQMLCELVGKQPEIKEINVFKMEHLSPEFKKINPMCTVPVLQDGDFILSESNAIMKYVLEKYGTGDKREELYPSELRTRAIVDQTMFFNVGIFFRAFLDNIKAVITQPDATRPSPENIERIEHSYSVLESYLQDRKFVATDHLTLADLANGSTAIPIQVFHKLDPEKYPRCTEWLARLQEEHVFKTINAPGSAFIVKAVTQFREKNKVRNKQ